MNNVRTQYFLSNMFIVVVWLVATNMCFLTTCPRTNQIKEYSSAGRFHTVPRYAAQIPI